MRLTARISDEEGGKALALLCYEDDPARCHRSVFAEWWEARSGEAVPELERGCGRPRKRQEAAQPSLFDSLYLPPDGQAQGRRSDHRAPHGHH